VFKATHLLPSRPLQVLLGVHGWLLIIHDARANRPDLPEGCKACAVLVGCRGIDKIVLEGVYHRIRIRE